MGSWEQASQVDRTAAAKAQRRGSHREIQTLKRRAWGGALDVWVRKGLTARSPELI